MHRHATVTCVIGGSLHPINYTTGMFWRVRDFIYMRVMIELGFSSADPTDNIELVRDGVALDHERQVDDQIKPGDMLYVRRHGDVEA